MVAMGGAATATAGMRTISGTAEADANAYGGAGGSNGEGGEIGSDGTPGAGGSADATSTAVTSVSGAAHASANATGGAGGPAVESNTAPGLAAAGAANAESTAVSGHSGDATSSATAIGGSAKNSLAPGGDATASSAATSNGSGKASSSASATGGDGFWAPTQATATANASVTGGGTAVAKAVATGGDFGEYGAASATSNAETAKGALAQATSTALGSGTLARSTAKTGLAGVSVQSMAEAPADNYMATTNAIAQGGFGQAFANPSATAYAFSTGLPDKAYATTLIDGASKVASALLGPQDAVFGTAIPGANSVFVWVSQTCGASSTFDFASRGDLLLGLIDSQPTDRLLVRGGLRVDGVRHPGRWRRNPRYDVWEPGYRREFLPRQRHRFRLRLWAQRRSDLRLHAGR
jgi:hypothetical protein